MLLQSVLLSLSAYLAGVASGKQHGLGAVMLIFYHLFTGEHVHSQTCCQHFAGSKCFKKHEYFE